VNFESKIFIKPHVSGYQQNQLYYCYTHCTADFIKKIDFVQRASSVSYGFYMNKNLWCLLGKIDVFNKIYYYTV